MMTLCARQWNEILVGAALAAIDVWHRAIAAKAAPTVEPVWFRLRPAGALQKIRLSRKGRSELQQLDVEIHAH